MVEDYPRPQEHHKACFLLSILQSLNLKSKKRNFPLSLEELQRVVAQNDKQRFSFN